MKRSGPTIELKALTRSVKEVESRFLQPHLGPPALGPPSRDEILDVAAYVVLVHGALENFAEGLALWVLDRSVANWTNRKKTTRATASLLLYRKAPADDAPPTSVFDNIRTALDGARTTLSKTVHDNHGITLDHLRTLFMPLGVNVPADPVLTASLELLVTMRHQWAHQDRRRNKVVKSAKDTQTAVSDCLTLAKKLSAEAVAVRP
jgi:hypothetical protein